MSNVFTIRSRGWGDVHFVRRLREGGAIYVSAVSVKSGFLKGCVGYCPDNPAYSGNFERMCLKWWKKFLRQERKERSGK